MAAPSEIVELVERFQINLDAYKRDEYKEAHVRVEFIDPFFEALGWDMRNVHGYAEQYKDVVHEATLKVGGEARAPDYCFRIGGVRKFFLEAKRPSVSVKGDVAPAYQVRRYAWSAKLPLSILSDFEELAVYDCRQRPKPYDNASLGRVMYLTFDEYLDSWDDIYEIFAKESVLRGSFDTYVQETKSKRGTGEVDTEFLKEIEGWRDVLARNIALRNPAISVHELNFAVQRTIDRIIFLRITEDRGIEDYGRLLALINGSSIYEKLHDLYRQADEKFNAGLFDFHADTLTKTLTIDDNVLKPILNNLYYPQSPYEFSVLSADILGQVYEQFLGKVIRLTPGHRAKVEEKPEVKKAGGVYYTPTYIVNYIVKQTVGGLVEGKTPRQISKLHILDPACGSGSFLLGAYQHLLNYHRQWYETHDPDKHAKKKKPPIYQGQNGGWRLTTSEKKRILLNNIFGVDIDHQAVEVTKLSLLLKVLEGETEETLGQQMMLWRERALPDLGNNIKCGNSLIGTDFFEDQLIPDEDEIRRVNPFDWKAEFPEIMAVGGFDIIVGNPPYVRIQTMKEWAPFNVEFYKQIYIAARKGNYDIYVVFVERALQLLNAKGRMGYILPHKFFQAKYGQALRGLIADGKNLGEIVHFGDQQIFSGATTYTCLLFLDKDGNKQFRYVKAHDLNAWRTNGNTIEGKIRSEKATESEWNFIVGPGARLYEQLREMPVTLENITSRIFQGLKTGADKVYIIDEIERDAKRVKVYSRAREAEYWIEFDLLHPLVKGGDSKRYNLTRTNRLILFPYALLQSDSVELIPELTLKSDYSMTWQYLMDNKRYLEEREHGKMRGEKWFGYTRNQALNLIPLPKIFTPDIAASASYSLDETGDMFFTGGVAGGYGVLILPDYSREYILGLLNSKLLEWCITQSATQMRGGYYSYESRFIRNLPIRTIDFDDPKDVARHDKMVALVERLLDLNKKLDAAEIPDAKELNQRQIEATDRQIDTLVYELYNLTEDEIRIVEKDR
jgi:type I restriction-modification system DNA methylase subunit